MKKWLIPNLINIGLFGLFLLLFSLRGVPAESNIFIESFSLSGLFVLFGAGIIFVDQTGILNIAIYGVKKFISFFKKPNPENPLPDTFYEYNEIRSSRDKINLWPTIITGSIYVIIGMIIYIL